MRRLALARQEARLAYARFLPAEWELLPEGRGPGGRWAVLASDELRVTVAQAAFAIAALVPLLNVLVAVFRASPRHEFFGIILERLAAAPELLLIGSAEGGVDLQGRILR
jgi:succinyl-CoA synthetase beta subunit